MRSLSLHIKLFNEVEVIQLTINHSDRRVWQQDVVNITVTSQSLF